MSSRAIPVTTMHVTINNALASILRSLVWIGFMAFYGFGNCPTAGTGWELG